MTHMRRVAHPIRWILLLLGVLFTSRPVQAQQVEYYGTDALGSVRVVFDHTGAVVARNDYLPFGESWAPSGNLPTHLFTGQQRHAEEGLDYFNARSYHVRTGRFEKVDPVFAGLFKPQAWNRYAYALNAPTIFLDPTGEQACQTTLVVGGFEGCPSTTTTTSMTAGGRSDPVFWGTGGNYTSVGLEGLPGWFQDMDDYAHGFGYLFENEMAANNTAQAPATQAASTEAAIDETPSSAAATSLSPLAVATPGLVARGLLGAARGWRGIFASVAALGAKPPAIDSSRLGHIFRNAGGHVNPGNLLDQARYMDLFQRVASYSQNLRPDLLAQDPNKVRAGIDIYTRTFKAGQVWVETRGGAIINAGVNPPGSFR